MSSTVSMLLSSSRPSEAEDVGAGGQDLGKECKAALQSQAECSGCQHYCSWLCSRYAIFSSWDKSRQPSMELQMPDMLTSRLSFRLTARKNIFLAYRRRPSFVETESMVWTKV